MTISSHLGGVRRLMISLSRTVSSAGAALARGCAQPLASAFGAAAVT